MKRVEKISLYRFGDFVALYLKGAETVYLNLKQSKELTKALNIVSKSIETEDFANSNVGTIDIDE